MKFATITFGMFDLADGHKGKTINHSDGEVSADGETFCLASRRRHLELQLGGAARFSRLILLICSVEAASPPTVRLGTANGPAHGGTFFIETKTKSTCWLNLVGMAQALMPSAILTS